MEFISEGIFGKYSKMKISVLNLFEKSDFDAFFRPSTLKKFGKKTLFSFKGARPEKDIKI